MSYKSPPCCRAARVLTWMGMCNLCTLAELDRKLEAERRNPDTPGVSTPPLNASSKPTPAT